VGQAVEDCIKAAETDATKRAFVTFGNVFGLALYDKQQRNVGTPVAQQRQVVQSSQRPMAAIDEGFDEAAPRKISERAKPSARPNGNGTMPF
jgi:recombination DNA repair RAD52 pathway protein